MALATLASALLAPELALAAPVGLGGVDGGWVATAPGPNQTGNGNINTAGLAFEAANSGWNSSNGDNDAGWVNYTPDAYGNSGNGWLPVSGSVSPFCLRREFTLGTPTPGSFGVEFDDDVQVWVNGALVIDDHNGVQGSNIGVNLLACLQAGENLIAIKAHNSQGGGYLAAIGGVADSAPLVGHSSVPEPGSLALCALALLGMAGAGRRQRMR